LHLVLLNHWFLYIFIIVHALLYEHYLSMYQLVNVFLL
jgi:hypothetical protein